MRYQHVYLSVSYIGVPHVLLDRVYCFPSFLGLATWSVLYCFLIGVFCFFDRFLTVSHLVKKKFIVSLLS